MPYQRQQRKNTIIDKFFNWIVRKQKSIDDFEFKVQKYKKYVVGTGIILFALSVFLILLKISNAIYIMMGIFFIELLLGAVGWRKSVKGWLFISIIINFCVSALVMMILQKANPNSVQHYDLAVYIVFGILWIVLSLLGLSKVTKLVNEIISAISTVIFTVGTYLISINMPDRNAILMKLNQYENNMESITDDALHKITDQAVLYAILDELQSFFIIFLPIIGISTICVAMISTKQYWMNKRGIVEPGAEMEKSATDWIFHQLNIIPEWKNKISIYENNIEKFQNEKRNKFELLLCDEEYNVSIDFYNCKYAVFVAKVMEEIDRLSVVDKVEYYSKLVKNTNFRLDSKMYLFDEYFEILKTISIEDIDNVKKLFSYETLYNNEGGTRIEKGCYFVQDNVLLENLRHFGLAYYNDDKLGTLTNKGEEFFRKIF